MNTVVKHTDPALKLAAIVLIETIFQAVQTDVCSAKLVTFEYTLSSNEFKFTHLNGIYDCRNTSIFFDSDSEEIKRINIQFKKWLEKQKENKEYVNKLFLTTPANSNIIHSKIEKCISGYKIHTCTYEPKDGNKPSKRIDKWVDLDFSKDYLTISTFTDFNIEKSI